MSQDRRIAAAAEPISLATLQTPLRVLTVGDGDFTLSLALARAYCKISTRNEKKESHNLDEGTGKTGCGSSSSEGTPFSIRLTATTLLEDLDTLSRTYQNASNVVAELLSEKFEDSAVRVLYGVDATQLHRITWTSSSSNTTPSSYISNSSSSTWNNQDDDGKFDLIMFHHPHLGPIRGNSTIDTADNDTDAYSDEAEHAARHFRLLCHYLDSASRVLSRHDYARIHVCVCGTQAETWSLYDAAALVNMDAVAPSPLSTAAGPILQHLLLLDKEEEDGWSYNQPTPGMAAPRRYRNGKHGSRHWLGKFGYQHRRTHGDLGARYHEADVNVAGSMHYLFALATNDNPETVESASSVGVCRICKWQASSKDALLKHLQAPALPDRPAASSTEVNIKHATKRSYSDTIGDSQSYHSAPSVVGLLTGTSSTSDKDLWNGSVLTVAETVPDGTRLRWFLQHCYYNSNGKSPKGAKEETRQCRSKRACEKLCRNGHVLINEQIVMDSARILQSGWKVEVKDETDKSAVTGTTTATTSTDSVDFKLEIVASWEDLVVVRKPVGVRTLGCFSGTLERAVSEHYNKSYVSLSRLDTGIGGLCVLSSEAESEVSACTLLKATFTVLVHGDASRWDGEVVSISLDGIRRWSKSNVAVAPSQGKISIIELCAAHSSSGSSNLSTLEVVVDANIAGIGGAVSYFLRQNGHPVVGDRFSNREYLTLPRAVRNRLKNKTCLGVTKVRVGEREVQLPVPDRWKALYWEKFCESGTSSFKGLVSP